MEAPRYDPWPVDFLDDASRKVIEGTSEQPELEMCRVEIDIADAIGVEEPSWLLVVNHGPKVIVATRRNQRRLRTTAGDTVRDRELWTVTLISGTGEITVVALAGPGSVTLPADYVRKQVPLGYATTEYGTQSLSSTRAYDRSHEDLVAFSAWQHLGRGVTHPCRWRRLFVVTAATNPIGEPDIGPLSQVWAETYVLEAQRLMRLATVLVGPGDAHDLVVDTVHRVVHRGDWAAVDEPSAYLTRAVVNAAIAMKRSAGRRLAREERSVRLTVVQPADLVGSLDVRSALLRLSVQQRAVAYFVYWEDLTIPQVAKRLNVSEGTVRKQLARAKERLREVLR